MTTVMTTLTVGGRKWQVEATGLQRIAYTLTSGKKVAKGVRSQVIPGVVIVMDDKRTLGFFNETTGRELKAV
jgi:hypothetical protein